MLRGIYTSESGMIAQMKHLDIISNNLANLSTNSYKKDSLVFKSFPEMLLRETQGKGTVQFSAGSYDLAPYIGKLGTGVSVNQKYTDFKQGSLKATGNPFDLAIVGEGFFVVKTPGGFAYTRDSGFLLDKDSYLVTQEGYRVQGENGDIRIKKNNFKVEEDGSILVNRDYNKDDLSEFVIADQNSWKSTELLDRLSIVRFYDQSALSKRGDNLYFATEASGEAERVGANTELVKITQGSIEVSNVNPVIEMTKMIEVHRTYEANQKSLSNQDELLSKLISEVIKI